MKDVFTEFFAVMVLALLAFMFFIGGIFYIEHENATMKFHCRTAAIQHGYTAAEVQVVCKANE